MIDPKVRNDRRGKGKRMRAKRLKNSIDYRFQQFVFIILGLLSLSLSASEQLPRSVELAKIERVEPLYCDRIQSRLNGHARRSDKANWDESQFACDDADGSWTKALELENKTSLPVKVYLKQQSIGSNGEKVSILMLSPKWSSAYDETSATIMEQFFSKGVAVEYILFNYQGDKERAVSMISLAEEKGVDLIFSIGSATTAFMTEFYAQGNIPVVSACSKDPVSIGQVDARLGVSQSNIAYTSLNISVETQISYLKEKFLTGLERIAVIYDRKNTSSIITQVNPLVDFLRSGQHGIELELIEVDFGYLDDSLYQPMKRVVDRSQTMGDTIFLITGSTEIFNIIDHINNFADQVPVLSVTPSHVRSGNKSVFVAIGVSFKTNAMLAADYAVRILEGSAETESLPVGLVSTPDISINFLRKPSNKLKVPFTFFEDSVFIYSYEGEAVRENGRMIVQAPVATNGKGPQ